MYGPQVVDSTRARQQGAVPEKYGHTPQKRVVVDFFPDQQDFAIRTLGMPGGLGIVGACFGNVITMNSPGQPRRDGHQLGVDPVARVLPHRDARRDAGVASRAGSPRGFRSTRRSLRDPSCGTKMNPQFRRRMLEADGLISIADLSAALTAFNDPDTINFAYYQSSLLVEYILKTYGEGTLRKRCWAICAATGSRIGRSRAGWRSSTGSSRALRRTRSATRAKVGAARRTGTKPEPESLLHRDPEGVAAYLKEHPEQPLGALFALRVPSRRSASGSEVMTGAREEADRPLSGVTSVATMATPYAGEGAAKSRRHRGRAQNLANSGRSARSRCARRLHAADRTRPRRSRLGGGRGPMRDDCCRSIPLLRAPHHALGRAAQEQGKKPTGGRCIQQLVAPAIR